MNLTEEQETFWSLLSRNYPAKRRCHNCGNWTEQPGFYGCILGAGLICDIYYKPGTPNSSIGGPVNLWKWDMIND